VSGTGTTYTVSVDTGTGSGTLRLDLVDDDSITNAVGNPLGGIGLGNGDFTSGVEYEIRCAGISGNAGVASATLTFDGGSSTADATTGEYSLLVPYNWSGKVTPSLAGYTFTPHHRDYSNVTTDLVDQSYAAAFLPPEILQLDPAGGTQACLRPGIGVDLLVTEYMRKPSGAFDKSTVTLKLDNTDVTNAATIRELMVYPSVHVTILYRPTTNLSAGTHQAQFTYPTEGGPYTLSWSFSTANIACATALGGQPIAGGSEVSPSLPVEPVAAPWEPAAPAPTAQIAAPTQPAAIAPVAPPTQAPAGKPRIHQGGIYYGRRLIPR